MGNNTISNLVISKTALTPRCYPGIDPWKIKDNIKRILITKWMRAKEKEIYYMLISI